MARMMPTATKLVINSGAKKSHGAKIGHAGLARQGGAAFLDQFENVDGAGIPDEAEQKGHHHAHHHGLPEYMVGLMKFARTQLTVDD